MSRLDLYYYCLLDAGSDSSPEYDRLDTSVLIVVILFITYITQYNNIYYTSFDVMMRTFSKVLYILFRISSKVFTHSKKGFSSYVKNIIIETYEVQCNIVNCVSCRI